MSTSPPAPAPRATRPRLLLLLLALLTHGALTSPEVRAGPQPVASPRAVEQTTPLVRTVDCVGFTVADLDREVEFFTRVLTFDKTAEFEVSGAEYERLVGVFGARARVATLRLGDERLELTQFLAPTTGRPIPPDSRSNDRWFQHIAIVVTDIDAAYARLRERGVAHASTCPQRLPDWNRNAGGIRAFYFKDPEGHVLELIQFPADKGDPKWRHLAAEQPSRLFLGIDHTAIVVSDTDGSLRLYRDVLGLRVAGGAENSGDEQEHLNNVFGVRLRITSLRAEGGGPGVELLEYLAPSDGRDSPRDSTAVDLWRWTTRLTIEPEHASVADAAILGARARLISPGPITLRDTRLGFAVGETFRDPDGHALQTVVGPTSAATATGAGPAPDR